MLSKALVVASYRSKLRSLAEQGVELTAVVPHFWKEAGAVIRFEKGDDRGYQVIETSMAWNGHFHLHYYPALGRIFRYVRPDIIHIDEEPYNLATYFAMRSGHRSGAATLFFSWQNIERRYPPPFDQIERYVYRETSYGLAGSNEAMRILRRKGYSGRARVLPQFGVDTELFHPQPKANQPFTVGFVGRLVPEKGVDDLLAAFRRMDGDARLVIAGDGPLTGHIDIETSSLRGQGRIERHARIPSEQVPELLRTLDVLVLPSRTTARWKEQYGRILIEAMASGVVVVGSDSGEIPNVIGDAGLIFREGDIDGLAEMLRKLSSSPQLVADLRQKGRERAVSNFSQQSVARYTLEVYSEIFEKP